MYFLYWRSKFLCKSPDWTLLFRVKRLFPPRLRGPSKTNFGRARQITRGGGGGSHAPVLQLIMGAFAVCSCSKKLTSTLGWLWSGGGSVHTTSPLLRSDSLFLQDEPSEGHESYMSPDRARSTRLFTSLSLSLACERRFCTFSVLMLSACSTNISICSCTRSFQATNAGSTPCADEGTCASIPCATCFKIAILASLTLHAQMSGQPTV